MRSQLIAVVVASLAIYSGEFANAQGDHLLWYLDGELQDDSSTYPRNPLPDAKFDFAQGSEVPAIRLDVLQTTTIDQLRLEGSTHFVLGGEGALRPTNGISTQNSAVLDLFGSRVDGAVGAGGNGATVRLAGVVSARSIAAMKLELGTAPGEIADVTLKRSGDLPVQLSLDAGSPSIYADVSFDNGQLKHDIVSVDGAASLDCSVVVRGADTKVADAIGLKGIDILAATEPIAGRVGGLTDVGDGRVIAPFVEGPMLSLFTVMPGDTDHNGLVDLSDFGNLKLGFGQSGSAVQNASYWQLGDFDGDRDIDLTDFGTLKVNFGKSAATSVPEPTTFCLLLLGAVCLWTRGRRSRAFT
jgi:hypothetical protein